MPSPRTTHAFHPRRRRRILLVQAGGTLARAAVAVDGRLERVTESKRADPHEAALEAMEQLEGTSRTPRRVVLLTAQAVSGVIHLPVDPAHPRPAAAMQEMVRWELEPLIAQHQAAHPIGAILVARGALTAAQAAEVARAAGAGAGGAAAPGHAALPRSAQRFGEIAMALGHLSRQALEAGLTIQTWFRLGEDRYISGWRPLAESGATGHTWPWLAASLSREARAKWQALFARAGRKLAGIYPELGISAACEPEDTTAAHTAIVEIEPDHQACVHLASGAVADMQVRYEVAEEGLAERVAELAGRTPCEQVRLYGAHPALERLAPELETALGVPVALGAACTPTAGTQLPPAACSRLMGGAAHVTGRGGGRGGRLMPAIAPRDPAPPVHRRPVAWWAGAASLALLLPAGAEWIHHTRLERVDAHLVAVEADLATLEEAAGRIEAHNERTRALQKAIGALESRAEHLDRRRAMLSALLTRHGQRPAALLRAMAQHAPPTLVVDTFRQATDGELHLAGWALDPTAPEQFATALQSALRPWALALREQATQQDTGRLALAGYRFELQFAPAGDAPHTPSTARVEGTP